MLVRMETQQTVVIPEGSVDINEQLSDITASFSEMLAPFILLSLAVTAGFMILSIISMVRRRKLENALLDMQKTLHEMNERDKARDKPQQSQARPESRNETIAAADSSEKTIAS